MVVCPGAHLHRIAQRRVDHELDHRNLGRVVFVNYRRVDGRRQEALGAVKPRGRVAQRRIYIRAVIKLETDLRLAFRGDRFQTGGVFGDGELLLELARDLVFHDRGGHARFQHTHPDLRVNNLRQQINRQALQRKNAEYHHGQCQHDGAYGVADGPRRKSAFTHQHPRALFPRPANSRVPR